MEDVVSARLFSSEKPLTTNSISNYADELADKRNVLQSVTGTKKAIHSVMITTDGLTRNEYWTDIQAEMRLDDLYEL